MGDNENEVSFEMIWDLIPENFSSFPDLPINSEEFLSYISDNDLYNGVNFPPFDDISLPVAADVNSVLQYSEIGDDKLPSPQNVEKPSFEMRDMPSMDVDLPESNECSAKVPTNLDESASTVKLSKIEILNTNQSCLKNLSILGLESIQGLKKKCEDSGWKFNGTDAPNFLTNGKCGQLLMNCAPSYASLEQFCNKDIKVEVYKQSIEELKRLCKSQGVIFNDSVINSSVEKEVDSCGEHHQTMPNDNTDSYLLQLQKYDMLPTSPQLGSSTPQPQAVPQSAVATTAPVQSSGTPATVSTPTPNTIPSTLLTPATAVGTTGKCDSQLMNSAPAWASLVQFCNKDVKVVVYRQSIEELRRLCKNQGVIFNDSAINCSVGKAVDSCGMLHHQPMPNDRDADQTYEVDLIYGHALVDDDTYYAVKWKNYTSASNTWEPSWHLESCREMVEYYHAMKSTETEINKRLLTYFVNDLISRKPCDIVTLVSACALCLDLSERYVRSLKLSISKLKSTVKEILTFPEIKLKRIHTKLFQVMQCGEIRKQVLIDLQEWEHDINAGNTESAYIAVENDVDLESSASAFQFIPDYINTVSSGPTEPVTFCNCGENCLKKKESCCPNESEGKFAYNEHGKLVLDAGYPIFECNDRCTCPKTCINRVVQHGSKIKVAIFRTLHKGWGLKTLEDIEEGQFVLEYIGEIITSEAAEARGEIYDYRGRSYLFDLCYSTDNAPCYTVDAGHVGNVAHFINHSCDPNLHVFAVWINEQDPCLPRLAFFARRNIFKGEELTFDYKMSKDRYSENSSARDYERVRCLCKSKNCRKYLF